MIGYGLSAAMQKAIKDGLPIYMFAEIDHPDGMVHIWSGVGDIEWDGATWVGRGQLARLSQIQSTQEMTISERTMVLRGVDPSTLEFLSANVRNRVATFWLGCVRKGKVVRDPYLIDELLMDAQSFPVSENGEAAIVITGFSGLWTLERPQEIAWSTEEAKLEYADETGFDLIPALASKEVRWRRT